MIDAEDNSTRFRAFRLHDREKDVVASLEDVTLDDLDEGDVLIRVAYSSINYKDALAGSGKGAIARRFPMIGGVDLAGEVASDESGRFDVGDQVLVCGAGLSETHQGGYAEYARVPSDWVVRIPQGLDLRSSMAIGTAGLTAALAFYRLEQAGQTPALGPVAVTGATGGVGSFAIDLLAARGYEVTAITGKTDQAAYLRRLGASATLDRNGIENDSRPLGRAVWGGAVDNLGGEILAALIKTTVPGGAIASIGLAASPMLQTTVLPFILRGVSLLGINSVNLSSELRSEIWSRLGNDLKPRHLEQIATREVGLEELPEHFDAYLKGAVQGRTLVRIGGD